MKFSDHFNIFFKKKGRNIVVYYEFDYFDADGWPHYKTKDFLPPLKPGEQAVLMKEAIVNYFLERSIIF